MKQRSLFAMFILMHALMGVYILYWICDVQNGIKYRINTARIGGGLTILLMIITLGLYGFIWQWKVCSDLKSIGRQDIRVVTLILSILLIGIVINPLVIQSSINSTNSIMLPY